MEQRPASGAQFVPLDGGRPFALSTSRKGRIAEIEQIPPSRIRQNGIEFDNTLRRKPFRWN
jgi:hypothetical protein